MNCRICRGNELETIYKIKDIPVFQNKVYPEIKDAINVETGRIHLVQCKNCGYSMNIAFEPDRMIYNDNYQNEQAYSGYFKNYLDQLVLKIKNLKVKHVIEIGCGKGYFLNKLIENGIEAIGYDPAYEGDNPNIIKEYFNEKTRKTKDKVDLIILRHVFEHVDDPHKFIQNIYNFVDTKTKLFIEVPSFEWIVDNNAFWDICYEHCNYFTKESLQYIYSSSEHGLLFKGQYQYIIAHVGDYIKTDKIKEYSSNNSIFSMNYPFIDSINFYRKLVKNNKGIVVWGAGAKGAVFSLITDPKRENIPFLIDINPNKQKKYLAKTGHKIVGPNEIRKYDISKIIVTNGNYLEEIKKILSNYNNIEYYILGRKD